VYREIEEEGESLREKPRTRTLKRKMSGLGTEKKRARAWRVAEKSKSF